ncbi:COG1943 Transposase and inactivated derivatives [Comamonadaceae bacterium]
MARLPRLSIAGHLHHVLQRGAHGQAVCRDTEDFDAFLSALYSAAEANHVAVHGYVVLADHFHLLVTPTSAEGLPGLMQALGRSYVRYFNSKYERRGTLWEGRFKSAVLQPRYLLPVLTYFDTHALRHGEGAVPADYAWSTHAHYTGARVDKRIATHPAYWGLGNTPFAREAQYQAAVQEGLNSVQLGEITDAVIGGWALGDAAFVADLQKNSARRLTKKAPGRPALHVKT